MDIGNSTKRPEDGIGFMGLGSKLLWDANKLLLVVTKTTADDEFAVLPVDNPGENGGGGQVRLKNTIFPAALLLLRDTPACRDAASTRSDALRCPQIIFCFADEVRRLVLGDGANSTQGLASLQRPERVAAFATKVFNPWLEKTAARGGHGTLIMVLGVTTAGFAELLENFDKAIGDEDAGAMAEAGFQRNYGSNKAQGDDCIELKTYLRFNTCAGDLRVRENLAAGGFDQHELGAPPLLLLRKEAHVRAYFPFCRALTPHRLHAPPQPISRARTCSARRTTS